MDGNRIWEFLHRFKADRRLVALLMIPNALGIGYGYYYYYQVGQFNPASSEFRDYWFWPLIPDSPNAVVLLAVAMVWYAFWGKRNKILDALAFTQMMYVGLWTTALFLLYPERMGTFAWSEWPGNANPLLFISHMAMPLEALILVRDMRTDSWNWKPWASIAAFSALFVAVDYWGPHIHPAPFLHPADGALHAVSPWLMVFTLAAFWLVARPTIRARAGNPQPLPPADD